MVLVDDGSTDGSPEIIGRFCSRYPDLFRSVRQLNQGAAAARKCGVSNCTGDYIMFLDADDSLRRDYLSHYIEALEKDISLVATAHSAETLSGADYANTLVNSVKYWGMVRKIYKSEIFSEEGLTLLDVPKEVTIGEDIISNVRIALKINKVKTISYDGYIDGENGKSLTRSRKWSIAYEKLLMDRIRVELGDKADMRRLWLKELRGFRSLVIHSDESRGDLREYRKEIISRRPSGINLKLDERMFLSIDNPQILRTLYKAVRWLRCK